MEDEFSPTWKVEGNTPQLKRGTLLHVRRKSKRDEELEPQINHSGTRVYLCD
jgi:hypothetical protein